MTFIDDDNEEIDTYNPNGLDRQGQIHEIGDDEELIGVYGVKDLNNKDRFSGIGFILKVKCQWRNSL